MNIWRQTFSWDIEPAVNDQLIQLSWVFKRWLPMLNTLGFPFKLEYRGLLPGSEDQHEVSILTKRWEYSIGVVLPSETFRKGYLGCIATRRRGSGGNDLTDGPFTLETWRKIVKDIHNYELGIGWEPMR